MIKEYEKVIIKSSGIHGVVVDIYTVNGETIFAVESDERGVPGGFGGENDYKLFDCTENELTVVSERRYGKTPSGGDYSEMFYLDKDHNLVEPEAATECMIHECKADGTIINVVYGMK